MARPHHLGSTEPGRRAGQRRGHPTAPSRSPMLPALPSLYCRPAVATCAAPALPSLPPARSSTETLHRMSSIGKDPEITEFSSTGAVGASPSPDLAVPQSRDRSDAAGRGRARMAPAGTAPAPRRCSAASPVPCVSPRMALQRGHRLTNVSFCESMSFSFYNRVHTCVLQLLNRAPDRAQFITSPRKAAKLAHPRAVLLMSEQLFTPWQNAAFRNPS